MTATAPPQVTVVGSVNRDIAIRLPRLPRPGETQSSCGVTARIGGKGANQAVAAARLGARTRWCGAVGEDGEEVLAALAAHGVDISGAVRLPGTPTGTAWIFVDDAAENAIVLDAGANGLLAPDHVPALANGVVLLQHEVPDEVTARALATARASDAVTVLNPAPFRPLEAATLESVDVLVVNGPELAGLAGSASVPATPDEARVLLAEVPGVEVVATLGAHGALIQRGRHVEHIPAPPVDAVETTGAGDTFCGALAAAMAGGSPLVEAAEYAVHAAALSVTGEGAQESMPDAAQVREFMTTGAVPAAP